MEVAPPTGSSHMQKPYSDQGCQVICEVPRGTPEGVKSFVGFPGGLRGPVHENFVKYEGLWGSVSSGGIFRKMVYFTIPKYYGFTVRGLPGSEKL